MAAEYQDKGVEKLPEVTPRVTPETTPENVGHLSGGEWQQLHGAEEPTKKKE